MKKITFFTAVALASISIDIQAQQMTISELFSLVRDNSKSMKVQRTAIEMADKSITIAKNQKLPDINTELSFSYLGNGFITDRDFSNITKADIPHYGNNFALEASQTVYTGGAITSSIRLAEIAKQRSEVTSEQLRQQLCFIALGQYLELYKIDNQIIVYSNNISLTQKLIENVKARQQHGTALRNDITRYELLLENQKLMLCKLSDERRILNHQLCTTTGCPERTIIPDTTIVSNVYAKDGEQQWQTEATVSAPTLKLSTLNIEMAHQQTKMANAERLPKIAIMTADHFDGPITFEVPPINKNLNYWYMGIGVKYEISSLFKSRTKIKQSLLALRQSQEEHNLKIDKVENDAQAAYTYYIQSYVELNTQKKSVMLAQQNYKIINYRYLNQLALVTDMVDAENIKLSAELQEVNAKIGIVYAYYKMRFVTGKI